MATENGNLDQQNRNSSNPDNLFLDIEILDAKEQTQAGAENLRESTIDSSISSVGTRSDLMIQQKGIEYERDIHSLVGFLSVIDKLLQEIEDTESGITKKGLSKAGKKTMNEAKTKLKQYKKQLKAKKDALLKQNRAEIYDNDISTVKNLWNQINKVREDIGMGQRGEFSSTASYLYNSPENAKTANKHKIDTIEFNQKLEEELKQGAISEIFGNNRQKANDYYRRIAEGRYTSADYTLFKSQSAVLTPSFQRCGILVPVEPRLNQGNGGRIVLGNGGTETAPKTVHRSADYSNMDFREALQQGGVAGVVDKALSNCKNLTPGQRNTWKSIAVLGGYAAGIYGLYKFFTSKKLGFWGKAGVTAAAILGSQIATGEGPISLFNKLMTGGFTKEYLEDKFGNAFGDAIDGVQNSGIESGNELSGAMYSMMVFNEKTKVGEVRTLANKFKTNPQERQQFRGEAITKLNRYGQNCVERFRAVFPENFDENKRNDWLNSIGIRDGVDDNKLVYELAGNKTMNTVIINKFLSDNGVKITNNKAKKEEFEQYKKSMNDSNQAIDISILENHKNDRFILDTEATFTDRPEDIQNKEKLNNQVNQLSLDEQTKSDLKREIQLFYDERPIKNKPNVNDFSLEMDNNLLTLKSHNGEAGKINLQNKTLTGFGHSGENKYEIRFTRIKELLDTAYLTNDILARQRNKQIVNTPPFQYKPERKGICFNDAETLSFNFDTRVLSTGRGGATSKIETLYNNPEPYAEYLSKCWLEQNKTNIDGALYPTVKKLSDAGITFTNEQEVKNLEVWLKGIKEKLGIFKGHPDGNPFSIGTLSKKLEFKAIDGSKQSFPENITENFPTLTREGNKEKFLNVINNPSNKMRGSALSS